MVGEFDRDLTAISKQAGTVGAFLWRVRHDRWWWSDDLYRLHGFEPGEVVPTSEMLAAHHHPEDLAKIQDVVLDALEEGGLFTSYHRIIDSQSRTHHVRLVGEAITNTDGDVAWLRGYVVDVSEVRRDEIEASIAPAVEGATRHRAAIEQAKGALMLTQGIDADTAFGILRRCSQRANLRVNVLAEGLADLLGAGRGQDEDLLDLLAEAAAIPGDEARALAEPAESLER